jgi:hypothetical protein
VQAAELQPQRNASAEPAEDPDLSTEPRPEELPPDGLVYLEMYGEAELIAAANPHDKWHRATPDERERYAMQAAITARRAIAQARRAGYDTLAQFIAASEDLEPISISARRLASGQASIGSRTASDLRHGTPPDQLADPFLTAEGPTVIYGRGGVGKGMLACWLARRLVSSGHVVMLVDFEGHEREWGSRLRGLGLTDDDLGRIHYRAPFGPDWTAPTGSLAAVAGLIRDDAERLGVTYLIVDSYSVATSNGDTMGGEQAAREYFGGLARIGLPSSTIAHVRGDSGKFPDRPFGSVFVHNLCRESWAVERVGDEPETVDPDEIRFGPYVVALELRNRKSNGRPAAATQFVTFSFHLDGSIEVQTDGPSVRSLADLAADVLADGPLTVPKIVAAIKEDSGQAVTEDALRRTLNRDTRRFQHVAGTRPRPWALR